MKHIKIPSKRKSAYSWRTIPKTSFELGQMIFWKYRTYCFSGIPYSHLSNDESLSELRRIYKLLKRCKPEPYTMDKHYLDFIGDLVRFRHYLVSGDYVFALDYLVILMQAHHALQERILHPILKLLEENVR